MEPGPEVTVRDPRAAPAPPTVCRPRRRYGPALALAAVLAVGAAVFVLPRVAPDAGSVLDLGLDPHPAVYLGASPPSRPGAPVHLQVPVRLTNHGPLPVRVRSAVVEGGGLRTARPVEVSVARHGSAQLVLEQDVACPPGRPPALVGPDARLEVEAATASGPRRVRLPLPAEPRSSVDTELLQLCGYLPAREAVRAEAGPGSLQDGGLLVVPVRLTNISAQPARVTAVTAALPGLLVELAGPGGVGQLPLDLPTDPGQRPRRDTDPAYAVLVRLAVRLAPQGCAALRAAPRPSSASTPGTLALLQVDQGPGTAPAVIHPPDLGLALPLLDGTC